MSHELHIAIDNASAMLNEALPHFAAGSLPDPQIPHGLAVLFRQLGACRMLQTGVADPLFVAQMQSAGVLLSRLPRTDDADKATSVAACFWDAVAGGYWDAATEIARHSRATHNPAVEHEDDFLYVWFLMQRFFLAPAPADAPARQAHETRQRQLLERWEQVLEGGFDPRLDLCRALVERDRDAFAEALLDVGAARRSMLERTHQRGHLTDEQALWGLPVWTEGCALLRLAERDGLGTEFECPDVPSIMREPNPFPYDPDAWRTADFTPAPNP